MKKSNILLSVLILSSLYLIGCASMSDVLSSKDDGTAVVYPVNKNEAWDISVAILRWSGTDAIEMHQRQGYMLTSKGANFITWGSMIVVWVEPVDSNNTKVIIVTKRKLGYSVATGLTEKTFQNKFHKTVNIIKSGKPLPIEEPDFNKIKW